MPRRRNARANSPQRVPHPQLLTDRQRVDAVYNAQAGHASITNEGCSARRVKVRRKQTRSPVILGAGEHARVRRPRLGWRVIFTAIEDEFRCENCAALVAVQCELRLEVAIRDVPNSRVAFGLQLDAALDERLWTTNASYAGSPAMSSERSKVGTSYTFAHVYYNQPRRS